MTIHTGAIKERIPSEFIYEMDEGKPILYRWAVEDSKNKKAEKPMPESSLQAWLKAELAFLIKLFFRGNKKYVVTAGEQGLSLKKNSWRGADIAIFQRKNFELTPTFAGSPPDIVIEINIKGYYDSPEKKEKDFKKKNAQLLQFGVKKIIWLFTEEKQVALITKDGSRPQAWDKKVEVMEGFSFCPKDVIDGFGK